MTHVTKISLLIMRGALFLALASSHVQAQPWKPHAKSAKTSTAAAQTPKGGLAEARLINIYRQIGKGDTQGALRQAEQLVKDFPSFALAQLVYGDLLSARTRPVKNFGDVSPEQLKTADGALNELKSESLLRLKALRERPPLGSVPAEFLQLSPSNKHAIAIDASRARLYLFENRATGPTLVADYYISVGKLGLEKKTEGDQRTPLGVYFITSQLDPKSLKDFYGSGALPINYPNVLDLKRGKTGRGIWLHGTPPGQFSRAPLASDGCVVLANPDLTHLAQTVEIRSTPVLIAHNLKWVPAQTQQPRSLEFKGHLDAWLKAKSSGNMAQLTAFYAPDFNNSGKTLTDWLPTLRREVSATRGRALELKDLSLLHWVDANETMVVTFGEVATGQRTGLTKRQYWAREGKQWRIFYEGIVG
ncbi:MAG: L,D-transpeptidase family protein [Rhodoferax sp.]|uniref:L,D-transpeptidase family protein n=1 Tax=Rhodoferax sp. TaxID=50421 RepID=UPI002635BDAA|nr:L,D-transpeptidase family protein [Rhodoferax sp.]MDD2879014.1 L,D-transpeptidase family protein [Rhodoferax sp.]